MSRTKFCQNPYKEHNTSIRETLVAARARGIKQSDIAAAAGMSLPNYNRIKRDPGEFSLSQLRRIYKFLRVDKEDEVRRI